MITKEIRRITDAINSLCNNKQVVNKNSGDRHGVRYPTNNYTNK